MVAIKRKTGTIFITGISASGKSTLGRRLFEKMKEKSIENVRLIDGEEVRAELEKRGVHCGYDNKGRTKAALEMAKICHEYNEQGFICILCSICHRTKLRDEMRGKIKNVMEVYLECPVKICAQRDYKGNYEKAYKGLYVSFIGVTEPYQMSANVDLILHTGENSIEGCSNILFDSVTKYLTKTSSELSGDDTLVLDPE